MKTIKKSISLLPIMMLAMVLAIFPSFNVKAEKLSVNFDDVYLKQDEVFFADFLYIIGDSEEILGTAKFVSAKSSNKKVATISSVGDEMYRLNPRKKGTTKITIKCKYKGKYYTFSKKIKVIDDKPFKYIKYGSKDLYKGNEYNIMRSHKAKKSKKLFWKLKKGYTLVSVTACEAGGTAKKFKNGSKVPLSKKGIFFDFTIKNKEGIEFTYSTSIKR